MAYPQQPYRATNPEDEQAGVPTGPGGGLVTGATASGGGIAPSQQGKPTQSGVFQNIGTYLKGAQGKSEQLSGMIAGNIEEPAQKARTGANEATAGLQTGINQIPDRFGLTQRVKEDPTTMTGEDISVWKDYAGGVYKGPTVTDQYDTARDSGVEAGKRGTAAGQRGGMEGLERNVIQRPMSPYERSLDVWGVKRYAPQPVQQAAKLGTETPGYVGEQVTAGQNLVTGAQETAKKQGEEATADVMKFIDEWRTGLKGRETTAEGEFGKRQSDAVTAFNNLTPNDTFTMDPANPPQFMVDLFGDRAGEVIAGIKRTLQPGDEWSKGLQPIGYVSPSGTLPPGLSYAPPSDILDVTSLGDLIKPDVAIGLENVVTPQDIANAQAWEYLLPDVDLGAVTGLEPVTTPVPLANLPENAVENLLSDLGITQTENTQLAVDNLLTTINDIDSQIGGINDGWVPPAVLAMRDQLNREGKTHDSLPVMVEKYKQTLLDHRAVLLGQKPSRPPAVVGTGTPVF